MMHPKMTANMPIIRNAFRRRIASLEARSVRGGSEEDSYGLSVNGLGSRWKGRSAPVVMNVQRASGKECFHGSARCGTA